MAVPAAIAWRSFIDVGGLVFALFMIAVGWACLHELYRLLAPLAAGGDRRVRLGGRDGARGPPRDGQRDIVVVLVATLPVLFVFVVARGQDTRRVSIAGTLLGVFWIGIAVTLAVLLRDLPARQGGS